MRTTLLAVVLAIGSSGPLWGGPIDPLSFTSLGTLTTSGGGSYSINTSTQTLTLPNGSTVNGVVYADTPGHNLAVFDFSSINIVQGTTITATGSLPLVLLSQSDIAVGGTINASGGFSNVGGFNPLFLPGPGGFSTGPGVGGVNGSGSGGGFGGAGGASGTGFFTIPPPGGIIPSTPGGVPYGNLAVQLQGGSAGGGLVELGHGSNSGGALEIGAVGTIQLLSAGSILANGSGAAEYSGFTSIGAGGGSGGGIFLHSHGFVSEIGGLISAQGGGGLAGFNFSGGITGGAGGGGGGRVNIETDPNGSLVLEGIFNVSGGAGGLGDNGFGSPGNGGQVVINGVTVPEPTSLATLSVGLATVAGLAWRHRKATLVG
jgi:hypothetical protein